MIQITRRLEFDAGHRLVGHESKCSSWHGHRYCADITCRSKYLDDIGRVIDFSKIKELVGGWIDDKWDHAMILNPQDPVIALVGAGWRDYFGPKLPFLMPTMNGNPTAENMVEVLARTANALLQPHDISVVHVRLYETPNCWADFEF